MMTNLQLMSEHNFEFKGDHLSNFKVGLLRPQTCDYCISTNLLTHKSILSKLHLPLWSSMTILFIKTRLILTPMSGFYDKHNSSVFGVKWAGGKPKAESSRNILEPWIKRKDPVMFSRYNKTNISKINPFKVSHFICLTQ